MIAPIGVDSFVKENVPAANFGDTPRLWVNGGGSSDQRFAYLYHSRPFPLFSTILTAKLRLYLNGSWTGTNNLTVKRITDSWSEGKLTWNNKPAVTSSHSAAATVTGGTNGQVVEFDIKTMMDDVSNGLQFFGFRIELSQHADRAFNSSDAGTATLRPELEVTWTLAPDAPTDLQPSSGDIVSAQFPVLHWTNFFPGVDGGTGTSSQVQLHLTTNDFTTPTYDTGKVTNLGWSYDLNDGVFTGVTAGQTYYWRVRIWDDNDVVSNYSTPVSFTRTALGTLTISSPGATTGDLTPPITWSLSGQTQESYRVTLFEVKSSGLLVELWKTSGAGTTNSVTVPNNIIVTGKTYKVRVEVWDTLNRTGNDHQTTEQTFTYSRAGTVTAPSTLQVIQYNDGTRNTPCVQITVTRSSQPDFWSVKLDGVEYDSRIDASDTFVSGTTYRMYIWGVKPRTTTTVEVEAVVLSGGVYKHSTGNPTQSIKTDFVGIWLADDSVAGILGTMVPLFGNDEADLTIGETGTTYDVIGARSPIRLVDTVQGYRGSLSGILLSKTDRDNFFLLKNLSVNQNIRLVIGDLSIPVRFEQVSVTPRPEPNDVSWDASLYLFQSGAPWPLEAV